MSQLYNETRTITLITILWIIKGVLDIFALGSIGTIWYLIRPAQCNGSVKRSHVQLQGQCARLGLCWDTA